MKLDEIQHLWNKDAQVDDIHIDIESLKIPNLHAKYLDIFNSEVLVSKKYESEYKKLYRKKWEYYNGKMTQEELQSFNWEPFDLKVLKQDISIYLDSDDDLNNIRDRIEYQKVKVQYLDQIIKSLNNRSYLLKNVIEWRRFTQGQL